MIATDAEHLSINLNCLLKPSEMVTINLPRKRFQNFHRISVHGLINYGCPLDEDIYVNGRWGRMKSCTEISVYHIRKFLKRILSVSEVAFSETEIMNTKFLLTGFVNLTLIRFLKISNSYKIVQKVIKYLNIVLN